MSEGVLLTAEEFQAFKSLYEAMKSYRVGCSPNAIGVLEPHLEVPDVEAVEKAIAAVQRARQR